MFQPLGQNGMDVAVGQGIVDGFPLPPEFDEMALLQDPKLVGNGALAHVQLLADIHHAQLLFGDGI